MGPKCDSNISLREIIVISKIYKDLIRKINFFEECSCFKLNNVGLTLGKTLKSYLSVPKGLKLRVKKL